jgi:ubiquinone/menaquinone biosynthesis C-methylase UbiE
MADESMVRTLAAQAAATWPQEAPLLDRYGAPGRILDAGCGTGEITARLAARFPAAEVLGVDVLPGPLALARARVAGLAPRVRVEQRSIFDLGLPDASFDLVVCRHVLQAVPDAPAALAELARVTRPGGWLHLVAEDYGMVHFPSGGLDAPRFWHEAPRRFGEATGTDMWIGRHAFGHLRRLGFREIAVDYLVVDTLRVDRETFAAIWIAWRDGYAATLAGHLGVPEAEVRARFDEQVATLRDPDAYAAWLLPVVAARVPGAAAGSGRPPGQPP